MERSVAYWRKLRTRSCFRVLLLSKSSYKEGELVWDYLEIQIKK